MVNFILCFLIDCFKCINKTQEQRPNFLGRETVATVHTQLLKEKRMTPRLSCMMCNAFYALTLKHCPQQICASREYKIEQPCQYP